MERLRKMQTLSHLRRKSPNALSLSYLIFIGIAVIYEMLSTAFIYLPPLMGVFFTYIIIKKKEAGRLLSGLSTPWFISFGFLISSPSLMFCQIVRHSNNKSFWNIFCLNVEIHSDNSIATPLRI